MGGADRVGHQESGNTATNVGALRGRAPSWRVLIKFKLYIEVNCLGFLERRYNSLTLTLFC